MTRRALAVALAAALVPAISSLGAAAPGTTTVRQVGYLTVPDGTQLRFTVDRPAGPGRFPVAMNYDGYCAGTGAPECNDRELAQALLAAGFAVVGVSVRGTGCSMGTFDFRAKEERTDGAAAVTWAASQPWSTGRVGLFGDSYPGLTQPGIAALRPKGLAAIAPFQIVDDVYRDVAYPGGIQNTEFGAFWGLANQPASDASNPGIAAQQGDQRCATNWAGHASTNAPTNIFVQAVQHPSDDAYWQAKRVGSLAERIQVPVFGCLSWQDDEVGSRPGWSFFRRVEPSKLWMLVSNGYHAMCDMRESGRINGQVVRFFDRYVRGVRNGWERTPRTQVWHETAGVDGVSVPGWVTTSRAWPPATAPRRLFLRDGGVLARDPSRGPSAGADYRAPAPSAGTEDGVVLGQRHLLWQRPVPPGGAVAWTTPALARDLEHLGPATADLWLTSTGTDTDLQVTVTEVRPDLQETYVARGWLRASHRQPSPAPLVPGVPTRVRVEVFPFDHVFRAGSSIRIVVDTPSQTGGWNFAVLPTPVTNVVLTDAAHPSALVLGVLPGGRAKRPFPACGTLLNQPCRPSAYPVPPGRLDLAGH